MLYFDAFLTLLNLQVSANNQHLLEFDGFLDLIENDMGRIRGLEVNGELKLLHIRMA